MNERVSENIYMGHNNFHTNDCVFTSPGWTRCAHKILRVHIARLNQVCTQTLACSHRQDEPGVHTNACVFTPPGMNRVCTQKLACSHRQDEPGVHTKVCVFTSPGWTRCAHKSLRVHPAQDEPGEHDACESQTHWLGHLCLDRTWDVIWVLKDNYWLNLQQVTPVMTYTNHNVYEVQTIKEQNATLSEWMRERERTRKLYFTRDWVYVHSDLKERERDTDKRDRKLYRQTDKQRLTGDRQTDRHRHRERHTQR